MIELGLDGVHYKFDRHLAKDSIFASLSDLSVRARKLYRLEKLFFFLRSFRAEHK